MTDHTIDALVRQFFWFHSIDLGNGIVTPGAKTPETHAIECHEILDPVPFAGADVLDIGAWNGFYSFEAKKRGAARVVACDHHTWLPSVADGLASFKFARAQLRLDIETVDLDVPDISTEKLGAFDVVLFLGVFYHLLDPIDGLRRAASVCRGTLVVETHLDMLDTESPAMKFYPTTELAGDATNWWGPNPACVTLLLNTFGFPRVEFRMGSAAPNRGIFHAYR